MVINAESGLSKTELMDGAIRAVRFMRKRTGRHYKITEYHEVIDPSSKTETDSFERAKWFLNNTQRLPHRLVLIVYAERNNGYGLAPYCQKNPIIAIGYHPEVPKKALWLKSTIAHEIGHTIGARHAQPELVEGHKKLTIMYPGWETWFEKLDQGLVRWDFSLVSKREIIGCEYLNVPQNWTKPHWKKKNLEAAGECGNDS